ncbi:MAG: hypothetical protein FWD06_08730 [Oscillospiraceae bacterium]|nr:hypothetical protein [Oscillospiraceae bacterium]
MKKITALVLAAALLGITLAACGDTTTTNNDDNDVTRTTQVAPTPAPTGEANHTFMFNNVEITMGALPDPVLAALGPALDEMREPNCAIEGEDVTLRFPGMILNLTYPADGTAPFIVSVSLIDDSVGTPEGLYIGAPAADIARLYGQYDREVNGFYYFNQGRSTLEIAVRDGVVVQIIYQYLFLD